MSCPVWLRTCVLALALASSLAAGCARTAPSRFYTLSATVAGGPAPAAGGPLVVIAPVEVAVYLDRPQIVTRLGAGEVALGEFDRWAEPLADGVRRVLAENLSRLIPSARVLQSRPTASRDPGVQVSVSVTGFDRVQDEVVLRATWSVVASGRPVVERLSVVREEVDGKDVAAAVSAYSRALAQLSELIAGVIKTSAAGA